MTKTIDAKTLHTWLSENFAILIDVREPDEFKAGHIPQALSLPLSTLHHDIEKLNLPKNTRIVFQCLSGKRGGNACQMIGQSPQIAGNDIYNLEGGINAWKSANFAVVGTAPKLSVFRQVQMIIGGLIAVLIALGFLVATGFFVVAGMVATALAVAGITGWCGLALLLQKMPWNK